MVSFEQDGSDSMVSDKKLLSILTFIEYNSTQIQSWIKTLIFEILSDTKTLGIFLIISKQPSKQYSSLTRENLEFFLPVTRV